MRTTQFFVRYGCFYGIPPQQSFGRLLHQASVFRRHVPGILTTCRYFWANDSFEKTRQRATGLDTFRKNTSTRTEAIRVELETVTCPKDGHGGLQKTRRRGANTAHTQMRRLTHEAPTREYTHKHTHTLPQTNTHTHSARPDIDKVTKGAGLFNILSCCVLHPASQLYCGAGGALGCSWYLIITQMFTCQQFLVK